MTTPTPARSVAAALLAVAGLFAGGCGGDAPAASAAGQEPAAAASPATAAGDQILALVGVSVLDMDAGRVSADRTVVIRGASIERVGPATDPVPEGATVVDGRGKVLLPGLADMHVHIGVPEELLLYVANGVTLVRNMNGRPDHLRWRDEIRRGERLGPELRTSGPTFYADPVDAEQAVRQQQAQGYDFIKAYHFMSRAGYEALGKASKAAGIPMVGHKPSRTTAVEARDIGMRSLEHLLSFGTLVADESSDIYRALRTGQYSFRFTYAGVDVDEARFAAAIADAKASGLWMCPTLVALDTWAPAADNAHILSRPHMRFVPPAVVQRWHGWDEAQFLADSTPESRARGRAVRRRITRALQAAGVPMVLGTDASGHYREPGYSVHDELDALLEAGLTAQQALQSAVTEPWRLLADDTGGLVAPGRRADLVLADRNPLQDVRTLRDPAAVVVRGVYFSRDALREMLERQAATH